MRVKTLISAATAVAALAIPLVGVTTPASAANAKIFIQHYIEGTACRNAGPAAVARTPGGFRYSCEAFELGGVNLYVWV